MVTDYDGTEIVPDDVVEAFDPGSGMFPARIVRIQVVSGKGEVTLTRLDTGEEVTRWHDAVIRMDVSST